MAAATSRTVVGANTSPRALCTSGYVGSPSYIARISAPTSDSGVCTRLGMPIRSRKSRMERVSASTRSDTIRTVSTSGAATVEPQSESSSQTAVWNSSSRTPRGISRKASYLPLARPGRSRSASARKRSQCATTSRRAVGTTCRHRWNAMWTSESGSTDSDTNSAT